VRAPGLVVRRRACCANMARLAPRQWKRHLGRGGVVRTETAPGRRS